MVPCRPRYLHLFSDPARDLLDNMLAVDIVNRFSAKECLAHPWMTGSASEISEVVGEGLASKPQPVWGIEY